MTVPGEFTEHSSYSTLTHKHGDHDWHQHSASQYQDHQQPIDNEVGPMGVIEGHPAQMFDGFHTMQELYEHRRALTAVLAASAATEDDSWRSRQHNPADSPMFDGYFIVGIELPTGTVTYHYPIADWDKFGAVPELEHAPRWDGHTPADVIARLDELADLAAVALAQVKLAEAQR